jgi:uncharacterized membrane protein
MYCEHCGKKIEQGHKFCTKCGHSTVPAQVKNNTTQQPVFSLNDKWWHRLLKVLYVVAYLPLLIIIPIVWNENSYSYYGGDTLGGAFWYSLLTLAIYMVIVRLIKIAVLYVVLGRKPEWKKEFKKLF